MFPAAAKHGEGDRYTEEKWMRRIGCTDGSLIYMLDYHNHLEKGELSPAYLEQFARQARARGVTEIGISEHSYMFTEFRPLYERALASVEGELASRQRDWLEGKGFRWRLEDYFDLVRSTRAEGIDFRVGLEVDYFPGGEELTATALRGRPWDYVIGSVHWVDGWVYDLWPETWRGLDVAAVWSRYFQVAEMAVRSGLFDVLGHPDSIKVFGYRPDSLPTDEMGRLVGAMAETGVAAELNTAFRYRGHSSNFCPDPEFLRLLAEGGVPITLGSDAHLPAEAGLLLDQAVAQALRCGHDHCLGFHRRDPVRHRLTAREPTDVSDGMDAAERVRERYLGSILGLAAGDAVGTTLEFRSPGTFSPLEDMVGGGPFGLEPGGWTDDTSMALCLAASLLEAGRFDLTDQVDRYLRWWREGYMSSTGECFDIGNTVRGALARYSRSGDPLSGCTHYRSAGNGSLMRLAAVPLLYRRRPRLAIERSGLSSRTTHGAKTAVDACRYMAALLVGALNGVGRDVLLGERYEPVPGYWKERPLVPEVDEVACGSFRRRNPPEIRGTGYVVKSMEAALWALDRSTSFREGCLMAANLGDDADTTAAVYGQLAGALYGVNGIDSLWLDRLVHRDLLEDTADRLYRLAEDLPEAYLRDS